MPQSIELLFIFKVMKNFKKILISILVICFSIFSMAAGCAEGGTPGDGGDDVTGTAKTNRVRVYDIPEGVERYSGAEVYINGEEIPVYSVMVNTSQSWTANNYRRVQNGVCLLELDGTATVTVRPQTEINYSSVVRPLSAKITPIANIEENELTFTFSSAGEYVLEINGEAYDAIHFFVSDYDESDGAADISGYKNVMVFEAGLHTAENDERISDNNVVTLSSDTLVYLEDGAVVRAKFSANNAENIMIAGRGVIDGSAFERDANAGTVTVPLEFNYCSNVILKQFFVLDPAGWCVNFYFIEDSKIDDVKIISSRSNGDGISLQSCKNIEVDGCFVRSWDDSLVVKNYPRWDDRKVFGETENITFTNCTVWTDLAQSMELGYETVGEKFENITFDNITVLHAMNLAVMSIHNANNAEIKNVVWRNITVEDGRNAADGAGIIDFRVLYSPTWSDQHTDPTPLGNVDGVTVENVNVISARRFTAVMGGCYDSRIGFESNHYVDNVTVKNIALAGGRPTEEECSFTSTGEEYLRNFTFVQDESFTVTGASFVSSRTDEYLSQFGDDIAVEIVSAK